MGQGDSDPPIASVNTVSFRGSASEPPRLDRLGNRFLCPSDNNRSGYGSTSSTSNPAVYSVSHSPRSAIIDAFESQPISGAPLVRGHRRRSTHVNRQDLQRFRREVLCLDDNWSEEESDPPTTRRVTLFDPEFESLNQAFESAAMSLNGGDGNGPSSGPSSGAYPSYIENPSTAVRQPASSTAPHGSLGQANGGGLSGMNGGVTMNAGHRMDLHHLYEMVLELSEVLKNNRDVTKNIVNSAEDIMKRASLELSNPSLQQANGDVSAARILVLERSLAKEKRYVEMLKREQTENTKLINEYETAMGTIVEQIRNYCQNNNMQYLAQKRHYNSLLQAERDSHLESRLDRDYWHAQAVKCAEMIRIAYHLRCEEEELPTRIVSGLQNEVRAYRNALGMEPEKPGEEYGWEILKDCPPSAE